MFQPHKPYLCDCHQSKSQACTFCIAAPADDAGALACKPIVNHGGTPVQDACCHRHRGPRTHWKYSHQATVRSGSASDSLGAIGCLLHTRILNKLKLFCEPLLQARALQNNLLIDLHIVAIISSRAMYLYNQKGCDMETWQTDMAMGVSTALYQLSNQY